MIYRSGVWIRRVWDLSAACEVIPGRKIVTSTASDTIVDAINQLLLTVFLNLFFQLLFDEFYTFVGYIP